MKSYPFQMEALPPPQLVTRLFNGRLPAFGLSVRLM